LISINHGTILLVIFVLFIFSSLLNSLKINVLIKITSTTFLFQIIFYSLTFGGETLSLAAAIFTIKFLEKHNVCEKIQQPVNLQYINSSNNLDWSKKQEVYDNSSREMIKRNIVYNNQNKKIPPHNTDHYVYVGEDF
jgi:hypothetical protein